MKDMLQIRIYDQPYKLRELFLFIQIPLTLEGIKMPDNLRLPFWFYLAILCPSVYIEHHPNQHVLDNSADKISRSKLSYSITSMGGCSKPLTGIICWYGSLLFNTYDFSGSLLPLLSLAKWNKGEILLTIKPNCSVTVDFCSFKDERMPTIKPNWSLGVSLQYC